MAYEPAWNEEYWMTRPITVQKRLLQIGWAFGKWQVWRMLDRSTSDAAQLRGILTQLGPAFVKIGQAVSSRPDVIPPDYLRELEKLQDDIPPFATEDALAVIAADLGQPVDQVFSMITPEPVAAASLGQVYKAQVRATGETVAIKVQRPGVLETIALDIFILRNLAKWLRKARKLNSDLPALIDEWAGSIYREISYLSELRNADEFRDMFSHYKEIYVPKMYESLSSERVLTMEWIDGSKPRRGSAGQAGGYGSENDIALVEVGVRCSLEQMLQEGFYHADPHPGNILRMTDGRLCYLDFGMMGRINRPVRQGLIRATLHLVNQEFDALADDFVTLGLLPRDSEATKEEIVAALTGVFEEALAQGVSELNFGGLSANLGTTMYKYKFRIPSYYTLLVRSLTILEGIALASDPNYKVLGAAYPWVARRLLTDRSPELRATLKKLLYRDGMFRFERLESLLEQAVRSPARPQRNLTVSNGVGAGAGARSRAGGPLALLLSAEGDFLRDIVLDELAKGIDAAVRLNVDSVGQSLRMSVMSALGIAGQERDLARGDHQQLPGAGLVQAMMSMPRLADDTDAAQVRGVQRLAALVQQLADAEQRALAQRGGTAAALAAQQSGASTAAVVGQQASFLGNSADMLRWMAAEASALPPEAQQQLVALPLDLMQRVSSRAAARFIKLTLSATEPAQRDEVLESRR